MEPLIIIKREIQYTCHMHFSACYYLLIFDSYICINLRDRDFKPLVCLSNAFLNHRCCVTLRRGWSRKGDIIDVFASVFLLSFSKVMYQADMLISYQTIWDKQYSNLSIRLDKSFVTNIDLTVPYGSAQHMLYAIPAVLFMCVFNIVPTSWSWGKSLTPAATLYRLNNC